jgi:hypothetical protein
MPRQDGNALRFDRSRHKAVSYSQTSVVTEAPIKNHGTGLAALAVLGKLTPQPFARLNPARHSLP